MNYTVIVVTYNRLELLKECLKYIDNQKFKFNYIVLVNNHSTDGTTGYLEAYCRNRQDIKLILTEKNLGGSGGFEIGVKNLPKETDYVLLIDDDAMLDSDFLYEINFHMENNIKAYSGTIRTDEQIDTSHRRRIKNSILMTKEDVPIKEYEKDSFLYDLSTFCGLVVSKDIIDIIGFPKGEYFIWYDDTEYSLRIREHTKIKNINAAKIDHKTIISHDKKLNWKSYYGYRNQIDFGKKFSRAPMLYKVYRYSYHRIRIMQAYFLSKIYPYNIYYKECIKLHKAVIRDSKANILGISRDYYPGKKLK